MEISSLKVSFFCRKSSFWDGKSIKTVFLCDKTPGTHIKPIYDRQTGTIFPFFLSKNIKNSVFLIRDIVTGNSDTVSYVVCLCILFVTSTLFWVICPRIQCHIRCTWVSYPSTYGMILFIFDSLKLRNINRIAEAIHKKHR